MKRCSKCREGKPPEEFGRNRRNRDGLDYYCRVCRRAKVDAWQAANPAKVKTGAAKSRVNQREKISERNRKWREANADYQRERAAKWHAENRQRRREYNQRWYAEHRDEVAAYNRVYYAANAETYRMRQRIRKLDAEAQEYAQVIMRDPCSYCGDVTESIDHIIPVADGGGSEWANLTGACLDCNRSKQDRPLLFFMAVRPGAFQPPARAA